MGFWNSAWEIVKSAGRTVSKVVKKVYEIVTDDPIVEVYDKLDRIMDRETRRSQGGCDHGSAPDFLDVGTAPYDDRSEEQARQLIKIDADLKETKGMAAIHAELSRLRSSAELIDRTQNNLKLHASSLSVHYQNMRNINGLIDDNNSFRRALKSIISAVNHNANVGGSPEAVKLEGIDIEKKEKTISQVAAFDAFDRTRSLLLNETITLHQHASMHLKDIRKLKEKAAALGGDLGFKIIDFADRHIVPVIKRAEAAGLLLKSEVAQLPAAIREQNGLLVFENGCIQLEGSSSNPEQV